MKPNQRGRDAASRQAYSVRNPSPRLTKKELQQLAARVHRAETRLVRFIMRAKGMDEVEARRFILHCAPGERRAYFRLAGIE